MSSYEFKAKNKETGEEAIVYARDDHFGRHRYGYMIEGNVAMTEDQFNQCWERIEVTPEKETPTPKTVEEVVDEFILLQEDLLLNPQDYGHKELQYNVNWLRTTLLDRDEIHALELVKANTDFMYSIAELQEAADERLREVIEQVLSADSLFGFLVVETPDLKDERYIKGFEAGKEFMKDRTKTIAAKHGITNL